MENLPRRLLIKMSGWRAPSVAVYPLRAVNAPGTKEGEITGIKKVSSLTGLA